MAIIASHSTAQTPRIAQRFAQAVGKVSLALPTQAGGTVRRDTGEKLRIGSKATQELQPVEQPVRRCGIVANLELAKPDKPADIGIEQLGQQPIKLFACAGIKSFSDPPLDPTFGGDQCVRTHSLDGRYRWQDRQSFTTTRDQVLSNILVRTGLFSLIEKPVPQITGSPTREDLLAVDLTQGVHMLLAGVPPGGIGDARIGRDTELSPDE